MGNAYMKLADYPQAVRNFKDAFYIDCYNADNQFNLALAFYENGDLEDAKKILDLFIDQKQEEAVGHFLLAKILSQEDKKEEALRQLKIAVECRPELKRDRNNSAFDNIRSIPKFSEIMN